jgi:hypothetical protein
MLAGRTMAPRPQAAPSGSIGDRDRQVLDTTTSNSTIALDKWRANLLELLFRAFVML